MKNNMKRLFSLLLTAMLLLGTFPGYAEGENPVENTVTVEKTAEPEKPAATQEPAANKEPEATKEPATETPVATEQPAATEAPVATEQPAATEAPAATEDPAAPEVPAATEEPVATEEPTAMEAPAVTEEPAATEAPAATEDPAATETPAATEEPAATEMPAPVALTGTTSRVDNGTELQDGEYDAVYFDVLGNGVHSFKCKKIIVRGGCAEVEIEISGSFDYVKANNAEYSAKDYEFGGNIRIPVMLDDETPLYVVYTDAQGVQAETRYVLCVSVMSTNDPATLELPAESGAEAPVDNSTTLANGIYAPLASNVSFTGGSGKTSFTCPKVTVTGGKATATLVINSSNYTWFKVGGTQYSTAAYSEGGVYAEVPVALNKNMPVLTHTTAMGGKDIEYTVRIVLTESDLVSGAPAVSEEFVISSNTAVLNGDVITVTLVTSSTAYSKLYLGSGDDDPTSATYISGTAATEGTGYTFVFELNADQRGQKVNFVPVKADGTWYSGTQCQISIPSDLVDTGAAGEETLPDGNYETDIKSDFSMFAITSQSASVKDGVVTVTIGTSKNTYDKFHIGTYADRDETTGTYSEYVQGVKKSEGDGYTFTFTLAKSYMGKKMAFVPGKPNGTWYEGKNFTQQYYMTIPKVSSDNKVFEDGKYETDIKSDFSMFAITSQSASVKDGVVTVTIGTSKNTYDKFHIGTYADRDEATGTYSEYVQGVKKSEGDGYTFTFTLAKSYMGKKMAFVPGKPNGTWYEGKNFTQQYYMTIPSALGNQIASGEGEGSGNSGYTDGDYTANVETWAGFKLKETQIQINGATMKVTLISEQLTYDQIYLGSYKDADKSAALKGRLANGNTAYAFSFTLPVTALGTEVKYTVHNSFLGDWMQYDYTLKLPARMDVAVPESPVDVNGYTDGEYIGNTLTYNKITIDGEEAYNNNAGFSPASTKIVISGNTLTVTFTCHSAQSVSYPHLFIGSKADAMKTPTSEMIQCFTTPSSVAGGVIPHYTFTLPRSALGKMITFTGHYMRNGSENWYEYTMCISEKLVANTADPDPDQPGTGGSASLNDGDYNVNVTSSADMFKVIACVLTAKDGKYTAKITLSGTGYDKLYMGTAENAGAAAASEQIGYSVNADGKYVFTVPVSALDTPIAVAAHSVKNDRWYDRNLTFKSEGAQKITNTFADGDYTATVETGADMFKVVSCTITVKNGKYTAKVALSGTGYDKLYMGSAANAANANASEHIGYSVNANGKYEFIVPVSALDTPIALAAHAVKSGNWMDRSMTFSSASMKQIGTSLADGDYSTTVETGADMFKVIACVLHVKNGAYTADITLSGTGYDKLYMGSAANAADANASEQIGYSVNADGKYVFTVPVSALDTPIALAAHAVKSGNWMDRSITLSSANLKKLENGENAGTGEGADTDNGTDDPEQTPESDLSGSTSRVDSSTSLVDGVYTPDKFSWSGGSGKVSISCKKVTVKNGKAVATLVFDSPNFSYVKANGQKIYGSHGSGTSTFQVPVALNANNRILGMTTKMTADHEIAYTVYIYIAGAKDFDNVSEEEKEAEIIGLNYVSTDEIAYSELFKVYRYEEGFTAIDVVGSGRYLLVPEGAEVPVGLDEDATLIQLPVQSVYVAADSFLRMVEDSQDEELLKMITGVGMESVSYPSIAQGMEEGRIVYAGEALAPNYAALLKTSCDIAILPEVFAMDEGEEIDAETQKLIADVNERMNMLGIATFVDRSADEKTEAGKMEWIKVYGMILGCEDEMNDLYEAQIAALPESELAA